MTRSRALLLSGGAGVGKTTIGQAIGGLLTSRRHVTGVLDLDTIAQLGPPQPAPASGLRFHDRLRVRNLAAVWTTYREAGARFMVVTGHVETPELRAAYTESLAECDVLMVRLVTPVDLIDERTRSTRGPGWDLQAALDQAATHQPIHDFTVTNDRSPEQVAAEVLAGAGWIPSG